MRIAFVTPEFVTNSPRGGGLGAYLDRIARALCERSHEVVVYVTSMDDSRFAMPYGAVVQHVHVARSAVSKRVCSLFQKLGIPGLEDLYLQLAGALRLRRICERDHREMRFDFVQASDCRAVGLFLRKRPRRPFVLRASAAGHLLALADGDNSRTRRVSVWLERLSMLRGDIVYAPSRYCATALSAVLGREVRVCRPPAARRYLELQASARAVPSRYLIHFGTLRPSKGSRILACALRLVFLEEPAVQMVWAGRIGDEFKRECRERWGEFAGNVSILGELPRAELYTVLEKAEAAVLPSLVDNLPNTAIEAILLGVPVIAFRAGSLDEVIEDGITGVLVDEQSPEALASAVIKIWRAPGALNPKRFGNGVLEKDMSPGRAVANLLDLVDNRCG